MKAVPKNFKCVNCGREQYTSEKCYGCNESQFNSLKTNNHSHNITFGRAVQFISKVEPSRTKIYLVSHEEYDNYSQGRVTLQTALRMDKEGLIENVFLPLEEQRKDKALLKRLYEVASKLNLAYIHAITNNGESSFNGEEYDKINDVLVNIEEFLGID